MTMTTPTERSPGFLACLREASSQSPKCITEIVDKSIDIKNFRGMMQYYELKNPELAVALVKAICDAVAEKMELDVQAHVVGASTFPSIVQQAVAFGIVAGAHLAKDRQL
jgi:hypothetical protein